MLTINIIFLAIIVFVAGALISVTIVAWQQHQDPAKMMAWLCVLVLLPGLGLLLYVFLGRPAHKAFRDKHLGNPSLRRSVERQKEWLAEEKIFSEPESRKLTELLLRNSYAPLAPARVEILTNGREKFPRLLQDLKRAHKFIHLEYYIFRDDALGREVVEVLQEKSREGIEVRLLLDGIGSHSLPRAFFKSLQEQGIRAAYFEPLGFPHLTTRLNFRNHRKIVVVDGQVAYLGGLNVGDEYLSRDPKLGFWRDTHLRLEGEIVAEIQATFANDWHYATGEELLDSRYYPQPKTQGRSLTQLVASGPENEWKAALQLFFVLLSMARESIYIETPYFIPEESMMTVLETAAMSGLDVQLVVQGVPDHKITYWAARAYFERLLAAGVKIYAYQKGILHSKVLLVDSKYAVVGSANFDVRSFKLNFELSTVIYDSVITSYLIEDFRRDIQDSEPIRSEDFARRSLAEKVKETAAVLFSPLL